MKKNPINLKYIITVSTILSAVFLFFNWFTLSIPVLESFLESGSFSVSFFTLPQLIEENALGLITRLGGKGTSIMTLLLCAILKYMCVLSAGFAIFGICKMWKYDKSTRFIFSSQVIALALQVLSFLVIVIINIFMAMYADSIAQSLKLEEDLLQFHFIPTVWLCLSTISAVVSLISWNRHSKEFE